MTKASANFFKVEREGINTTFQDNGRKNLNHIGIPISGAMDKRNFMLANALLKNEINKPVIEFAYQGPLLEFNGDRIYFVITGDVKFEIIKNNKAKIAGLPYNVYVIENKDQIDIQSTNKSVYGYLSISENIILDEIWDSVSINTKAKIGSNNGEKLSDNQKNEQTDVMVRYLTESEKVEAIAELFSGESISVEGISSAKRFRSQARG